MEPDHFYLALFDEKNISQTTDTEPIYRTIYTIKQGPYSSALDAWEAAWLTDEEWDKSVVLGFKGVDAIHAYYELMSDEPTEHALDAIAAEDALYTKVSE